MPRAVIDVNLFVRWLLNGAVTAPLFGAWARGDFQILLSPPLWDELVEVLSRPRLRKRISEPVIAEALGLLRTHSEFVEGTVLTPRVRDPDDSPILAAAIVGNAQFIVTGDSDLRADDRLRAEMLEYGVEILGVNGFLARLDEMEDSPVETR